MPATQVPLCLALPNAYWARPLSLYENCDIDVVFLIVTASMFVLIKPCLHVAHD